ncbi:MAG: hypothetical protein EA362_09690 [Saprospirales bacterium]|nr:MAG: hypothetical protein EA362_09690 [Saprospirales bacterium]
MISIDEINKSIGMSARALNICMINDLKDVDSLLSYYHKNGDFLDLTNCGIKSNLELKILCEHLKSQMGSNGTESLRSKVNPKLKGAYENLSKDSRKKLSNILRHEITKISLRSRNSFFRFFDGEVNVDQLYSKILSNPTFDPLSMEGVGRRSEKEIKEFITLASDLIIEYGGDEPSQ